MDGGYMVNLFRGGSDAMEVQSNDAGCRGRVRLGLGRGLVAGNKVGLAWRELFSILDLMYLMFDNVTKA